MIIDFHTHIFPDEVAERAVSKLRRSSHIQAYSDGTAEGLRRTSAEAGIGLSVILPVATAARQVEHINDRAIALNRSEHERILDKPHGSCRLLSFGCMHPEYEDYRKELRRIAEAGVPGIKLHPYFHGCDMDDIRYLQILDAAADSGLIVVTHAGYDQGFPGQHNCTVPMIRKVMQQVKGITMVAAHMGGWKEWGQVPELLADTGIYLDTSFAVGFLEPDAGDENYWQVKSILPEPGMVTERECLLQKGTAERRQKLKETAIKRSVFGNLQLLDPDQFAGIVRSFPEGHILFATDSPWSEAGTAIRFIQEAPVTEEQKESILGGAAQALLSKHHVNGV